MAEKVERYKVLPKEHRELLEEAAGIQTEVMERLEDSVIKYGTAYTLADIEKEFESELLDLVGWPLLMVTRMRRLMSKRLAELNGEYLEKFLSFNDDEYLEMLYTKIGEELSDRAKKRE